MGSTVSKPSKQDSAVDSKGRFIRASATVACEKSEIDDDVKRDIIASSKNNSSSNNVKKGGIRFSALLQQRRKSKCSSVIDNDPNKQDQQQQQQQQRQQQQKKKKKGKKHNVKSISVKRNAKYKRVTKSIIGKPANFQHMSHIGADQPARMVMHPDDQFLAQQLRDITARVNSLMDEAGGGQDQMTIPVSPSTPTSSSSAFHQQNTQTPSPPTTVPTKSKTHQQLQQDGFKQQHQRHQDYTQRYPEHKQQQQQPQRKSVGPPPPPPAHWSSLALRQAMRRQQQINHHKRLQLLQQQQQQTQQLAPGQKVPSMKRRNVHPSTTAKKMRQQRSTGRRPRANHVSPNALGMPPSLRLGPAR
ncbi:hypothetical protein BDB00DRAFT_867201 [Zychaea mexicana]|uniref:uncharacterized protein n=1 Tax=Zychaea mexicana TaxID=64656 RepID=UPI0022FF2620|nr:uncharacterized protein BDB00DRAFT_867201 [Zychaea mexicana]KAI9498564.1 hypothetical protein BDB00DRAFT_867201 [Zychaea mexicana]